MKFDVIIMNSPYQAPKSKEHEGRGKCGASLWEAFVEKSFELGDESGFICNIHPNRWRKPNSKIGQKIKEKQIHYLEMHNTSDGLKTFGCNTDYDWYIAQNKKTETNTQITDYNGNKYNINLNNIPFIPNSNVKDVLSLVAKDGEKRVELLHSFSAYETRKTHMSPVQTDEFKYPCVYTVCANKTGLWYSNKKEQFFGIHKVIWGNGLSKVIIDKDGRYGLTQFAVGISDDVKNLINIQKALSSEKFIKNVMGYTKGVGHIYDKNIIETFRKDFWKEFI